MRISGSVPEARSSSQVSAALGFDARFGIFEEELYAIQGLHAQNRHACEVGRTGLDGSRAGDGTVLERIRDVKIDAPVVMLAKFALQIGDKLAEGLLLIRHHVGKQQGS